jgi:hypothetical protein
MDEFMWCIYMPDMGSVHCAAYNLWRCFANAVVAWHTSCWLPLEVTRACNAAHNTSMHIQQQQQQRIATHVAWLRRRLQKLRDVS